MESNLDEPPLFKQWFNLLRIYGHLFDADSREILLFARLCWGVIPPVLVGAQIRGPTKAQIKHEGC